MAIDPQERIAIQLLNQGLPKDERAIRRDQRMMLQGEIEAILTRGIRCASAAFPCNSPAALAAEIMREVERRLPHEGHAPTVPQAR